VSLIIFNSKPPAHEGGTIGDAVGDEVGDAVGDVEGELDRAKVGLGPARDILQSQGMMNAAVEQLIEFLTHQYEGRHGRARERRRAA
jgi:UDP-N-acetylglucosamine acyltransferase